jgi:hypothetical protein
LDESGILGATPDGLVGNDSLLEVKCPYTQRNLTIAEGAECGTFCLEKMEDGKFTLKKNHVYWHQVQGQLHLTNRRLCYFVVWTSKECVSIPIAKDDAWKDNLEILKDFYYNQIFPKVVEGEL